MDIPQGDALIFFSDLDGTLLDHEDYSYEPAVEALRALRTKNIPLILASSKTAAEIAPLRAEIGFSHCEAIVENGAGTLINVDPSDGSSEAYSNLLEQLTEIPDEYRQKFTGFSQWSTEQVSNLTGLSTENAARAKARQFSEPGIWSGDEAELEVFKAYLEERGMVAQKGGRFLTLSFGADKVDRMREIIKRHRSGSEDRFSIALGDAPNDVAMLREADLGIVIPNPAHGGLPLLKGEAAILHAKQTGPYGWNSSVLDVLDRAGLGG